MCLCFLCSICLFQAIGLTSVAWCLDKHFGNMFLVQRDIGRMVAVGIFWFQELYLCILGR
jgi:hypothetical protein